MHRQSLLTGWCGLSVAMLVITWAICGAAVHADSPLSSNTSNESVVIPVPDTPGIPDIPASYPPSLVFDRIERENVSCTVYGSVAPGSENETILSLRWTWGDNNTPEYHGFPNSHDYHNPGKYILTVTAEQSDGQYTSKSGVIDTSIQAIPEVTATVNTSPLSILPAGPGIAASPPSLTLLEPVTSRLNVTLNGNLNAGGPGVTIRSVTAEWNDGFTTDAPDLPITHHYNASGIYTINVTGIQSDGQSTSKRITVELESESPAPPLPAGSNPPRETSPLLLIGLVTGIVIVILALAAHRLFSVRRSPPGHTDVPKSIAVQEDLYYSAHAKGDIQTAAASAHVCAKLFRTFAENTPHKRESYLSMAEKWEKIARDTVISAGISPDPRRTIPAQGKELTREFLEKTCSGTDVQPEVLIAVIRVAMEIAREGREGQPVGTSFVIGDTDTVMSLSRQFVLNPFHGHTEEKRDITDAGIRGNIKEFAQLDGAFIVSGNGIVEAAGRYLTVDVSGVKVPDGLGSRHSSVAGITRMTKSIGVVVSQSGGLLSIFRDGTIVQRIHS